MTKIWLAVLCAAACGALVLAEQHHRERLRIGAKVVASLAFLALGIIANQGGAYGTWIVIGLALGMAGDIALLGRSNLAFLVGLGGFLLGHVAYIVAMATRLDPREWVADAWFLAAVPAAITLIVVASLWSKLGSMRVPVIAYGVVIATMVVGAIALYRVNPGHAFERGRVFAGTASFDIDPGPYGTLLAGACLFFASDLSVARDKFVGASFTNKAWGLPAYYAGQLLIAWSLTS